MPKKSGDLTKKELEVRNAEEMCKKANDIFALQRDIERLRLMLQMAYCQKIGSDAPHGLDCCDDYRDWLKTLTPNV